MKKIITAKKSAASTKATVIKIKTTDRWSQSYPDGKQPKFAKDRMERGEIIRRIHSIAPDFQGAHNLSINDLREVEMGMTICQINRLSFLYPNKAKKKSIFING